MFNKDLDSIKNSLESNFESGMTSEQAEILIEKNGLNVLKGKRKKTLFEKIIEQFKDILIIILIIAALLSMYLGEYIDGAAIIVIVILNSFLSIYQENRAGNALEALKKMTSQKAKVLRDGKLIELEIENLVVGDIVLIDAGDYIPADMRLFEIASLKIDESAITGESVPVEKTIDIIAEDKLAINDQINMVFKGTVATYGKAKGIVTAIGMDTEIGKIATLIDEEEEGLTPLQIKLNNLGKYLAVISLAVSIIIFIVGILQGKEVITMLMISVSLAVAAIPEGLPAVVSVILAVGMQKMVKKNVIVKKLSAVETLGSTTIICSDKTGTLTQNKMTVVKVSLGNEFIPAADINTLEYKKLIDCMVYCNDAKYSSNKFIGDPTEIALLEYGDKFDFNVEEMLSRTRISELPFDSERKMMSVNIDGTVYSKGAIDSMVNAADKMLVGQDVVEMTSEMKDELMSQNEQMAKEGLRVLTFAFKENKDAKITEDNLIFIGMVAMIDPPREDVYDAIEKCHHAGINVAMITGDHITTAKAIGKDLGISTTNQGLMGVDLDQLNETEFKKVVEENNVYARVSPKNKVQIIDACKDNGHIVAMTGDGVNDAPSLKRADIGIAMGIVGTDVSKNAADMILLDDSFASIVDAIEEGRKIFANIRKFVLFLLSCNIGEILIIFVAILLGWDSPLVPIQLLFVNLVTDSFPAFALGLEEKEEGIMDKAPNDPDEQIVNKGNILFLLGQSIGLAFSVLLAYQLGIDRGGLIYGQTFAFLVLIIGEMIRAYSSRKESLPIYKYNPFGNKFLNISVTITFIIAALVVILPPLNLIFKTTMINVNDLGLIILVSFIPLVTGELIKIFKK